MRKDPKCDWYWEGDTSRPVNKTLLILLTFGTGDGNSPWQIVAGSGDAAPDIECTLGDGNFQETDNHLTVCQAQLNKNCLIDYLVI